MRWVGVYLLLFLFPISLSVRAQERETAGPTVQDFADALYKRRFRQIHNAAGYVHNLYY